MHLVGNALGMHLVAMHLAVMHQAGLATCHFMVRAARFAVNVQCIASVNSYKREVMS